MGIHVPAVGSTQEGGWTPTGTWPFAAASADVHLPRNMATQPSEKISPKFLKRSGFLTAHPFSEHKLSVFLFVSLYPV